MKFSFRRRVEGLSMDDIDARIDEHQHHAEELISELKVTVEEQGHLLQQVREARSDADTDTTD
jgi:hypothetical protein